MNDGKPRADDGTGPTPKRRERAGKENIRETGRGRSNTRVYMLDDALSKARRLNYIDEGEYSALKKYSLHWLAGGLQGQLSSVDLNRIYAFNPGAMSGLAKTERQEYHRTVYWKAHDELGERPAFVADHIACYDTPIADLALFLGYKSKFRGRENVKELLSDAGYRLIRIWKDLS